tara:strand:- start:878 stop:1078 length:201 start_codon:yes stop_codon:yes gene_type:complete
MINIGKVKKVFNESDVQLSAESLNMIREDFNRHIKRMAERCKDGNVKRLTDKTYFIAVGNLSEYLK